MKKPKIIVKVLVFLTLTIAMILTASCNKEQKLYGDVIGLNDYDGYLEKSWPKVQVTIKDFSGIDARLIILTYDSKEKEEFFINRALLENHIIQIQSVETDKYSGFVLVNIQNGKMLYLVALRESVQGQNLLNNYIEKILYRQPRETMI